MRKEINMLIYLRDQKWSNRMTHLYSDFPVSLIVAELKAKCSHCKVDVQSYVSVEMEVVGLVCFFRRYYSMKWNDLQRHAFIQYNQQWYEHAWAHTHACKQAGRWRSSESVRHKDTQRNSHWQIPIPSHTNTYKAILTTHTTHPPHNSNCSWHFFVFLRAQYPRSILAPQMPTSSSDIPTTRCSRSAVCSRSCCWGDDASGLAGRVPVGKGSEDRPGMTNRV